MSISSTLPIFVRYQVGMVAYKRFGFRSQIALKKEENTEVKTDEDMKSVIAKVKEEVALEDEIEAEKWP